MYLHVYKNNPTDGGVDGSEVSETIESTLSSAAASGATTITVNDATGFHGAYGTRSALIGTETKTIASVNYDTNVITLSSALTAAHAIGETVINATADTNPIATAALDATTNQESAAIALALRCETGYKTYGAISLQPVGTTANAWELSLDGATWGGYGNAISIESVIESVNILFYARAKAIRGESPSNDITVDLQISGSIVAV